MKHSLFVARLGPDHPVAPPAFLASGLFPRGQLVFLDGPAGVGKTFLAAAFAAQASRGALPGQPEPANIIWAAPPEPFHELTVPYLYASKLDLNRFRRIHHITNDEDRTLVPFRIDRDLREFHQRLMEYQSPLVIIDGIDDLLWDIQTQHPVKQRHFWQELQAIARLANCCILVLRNQGLHQPRQATAFHRLGTQLARVIYTLAWHPDHQNHRILTIAKNQLGSTGTQLHFTFSEKGAAWQAPAADQHRKPGLGHVPTTWTQKKRGPTSRAQEITHALRTLLARPQKARDIWRHFEGEGYNRNCLRTALKLAGVKCIHKPDGRWYILHDAPEPSLPLTKGESEGVEELEGVDTHQPDESAISRHQPDGSARISPQLHQPDDEPEPVTHPRARTNNSSIRTSDLNPSPADTSILRHLQEIITQDDPIHQSARSLSLTGAT